MTVHQSVRVGASIRSADAQAALEPPVTAPVPETS